MDVIVKEEKQESKYANQLYLFSKPVKREPIDISQPTTSSQKFLLPVKAVQLPVRAVQYRVATRPTIRPTATLKVQPTNQSDPRQSFLFPVKRSHPAGPLLTEPSVPLVPKQGNFRMRLQPPVPVNRKRNANFGNEASGPAEEIPSSKKKKNVEEALNELDKEYEKECGKKVKLEWLSGNYPVRKECIKKFEENAHPSPKEILEIATRFNTSYRMIYDNFHRIRVHHEVPCKPGDNCIRIQNYFNSVAPGRGYFRLTAEQRNVLEVEMFKMFEQSTTLNVGQMHVLADITGLPTYVVRSQSFALRKRYLVSSNPDGSSKAKAEMRKEFSVDPFPNPKVYQIIASRLDIRYDDVQRFYNSARLRHVKKHGQYEKVQEELSDRTAEALWKVARAGKQLGLEKRKELAKNLRVSYSTIAFWLDNYMSQLRWGFNTYRVDVSDDEAEEGHDEEEEEKEEEGEEEEKEVEVEVEVKKEKDVENEEEEIVKREVKTESVEE